MRFRCRRHCGECGTVKNEFTKAWTDNNDGLAVRCAQCVEELVALESAR